MNQRGFPPRPQKLSATRESASVANPIKIQSKCDLFANGRIEMGSCWWFIWRCLFQARRDCKQSWSLVNISIITCLPLDVDNSRAARETTITTKQDLRLKIDFRRERLGWAWRQTCSEKIRIWYPINLELSTGVESTQINSEGTLVS